MFKYQNALAVPLFTLLVLGAAPIPMYNDCVVSQPKTEDTLAPNISFARLLNSVFDSRFRLFAVVVAACLRMASARHAYIACARHRLTWMDVHVQLEICDVG